MGSSLSLLMAFTNLFSENLIAALVAFDNRKQRMCFDLGHFTPGRSLSSQLVIRLSSTTVPHPIGSPAQPSDSSPLALVPLLPNHALPYAIYFCPAQARFAMVYDLDVNHPAPLPPPSRSSLPLPQILFLSSVGTLFVVTLTLVSSLMSTKCSRTTSPLLSTLLTTVMALTLSLFHRNISFRPSLSPPLASNKPGLLPVPPWPLRIRLVLNMFLPLIVLLKPSAPPLPMLACKLLSLARSPTNLLMTTPRWLVQPSKVRSPTPLKLKTLWIVSSLPLTILLSLSMRNITLLSPSFLSLIPGPLSRLTSALTSHFWNAILLRTCFLAVAVLSLWMSQLTLFLMPGSNSYLKLLFMASSIRTTLPTPPHHSPDLLCLLVFWHAHLNHACTRAVSPLGGAGTTDNMAGDQLAIWNQVNVHSNEPIPSTHLTIFVPPALGAFILANLKSPKGDPPQLRPVIPSQPHLSSVLTASRPFHLDLPLIFPENEDLIMDNARQAAAAGFIRPESIPLLALTDESFYHGKLSWTLRFPVPPPDTSGSVRRFSSTVTFRQGPHSAEALEGALRLATPFSYNNDASHVLFNSPFLRLPDLSVLRPPRIDSYENPSPPEHAVQEWLNIRAPRLIPSRYREYSPVPLGLVDYFNSNIHLPQVGMLIETHQCNNEDATAEARKHKRDFAPTAFLRIIPAGTVMTGNRLPDLPSTSPTPETLPHTARSSPFHHPSQTRSTFSTFHTTISFVSIWVNSSTTPSSFWP